MFRKLIEKRTWCIAMFPLFVSCAEARVGASGQDAGPPNHIEVDVDMLINSDVGNALLFAQRLSEILDATPEIRIVDRTVAQYFVVMPTSPRMVDLAGEEFRFRLDIYREWPYKDVNIISEISITCRSDSLNSCTDAAAARIMQAIGLELRQQQN